MQEELGRAQRFQRPMALIMADLDLLRDINNTYGHLAGDAVLRGVAEVFRQQLRHYDVPARFGGEEFSILLPETPPEQAFEIADRIRRAVAARLFEVETSSEPIRATISMGVAALPARRPGRERSSCTRPTSPSIARSSRDATASSTRPTSCCSPSPTIARPRLASLPDEQRARRRRSPLRRRSSRRSSAARPHVRTSRPCRASSRSRVAWRSSSASWASWAPPRASRARSSARRPT